MQVGRMKILLETIPQIGKVEWIGIRPARREALQVVKEIIADKNKGLEGERFDGGMTKKRQVTLIQQEHISTVCSILKKDSIDPGLLRRNIVVSGINLLALKDKKFRIGTAVFKGTGLCQPCSRMEENLGPGGYNAMRGHGGITAKVIQSGRISVKDQVCFEA